MEEFKEVFLKKGFPKIFNDIKDPDDILRMYSRDLKTNQKLEKLESNLSSDRRIPVTFNLKDETSRELTLIPGETIFYIINEKVYYCARTYWIEDSEISMSREYIKRLNSGYKKKRLEMISNDT